MESVVSAGDDCSPRNIEGRAKLGVGGTCDCESNKEPVAASLVGVFKLSDKLGLRRA